MKETKVELTETRCFLEEWAELRERSAGRSALAEEPTYALPISLIDSLNDVFPDLITREDLEWENSLAYLCIRFHCVGVLAEKPVVYPLLDDRDLPGLSREQFDDLGWRQYWTYEQAVELLRRGSDRISLLRPQMQAYAGWLVTNSTFLQDVGKLRGIEEELRDAGIDPLEATDAIAKYQQFCTSWQISGMATWDLPVPRGIDLSGLGVVAAESELSMKFCMPATMRLPARFPLADVIAGIRAESTSEYLAEWQNVLNLDGKDGTGLRRYTQMLRMHFYRNIALSSRYAERMRGNTERIDIAFAKYFGNIGSDSVKKLRLEIERRLNRG
jgi:hypothetical protein